MSSILQSALQRFRNLFKKTPKIIPFKPEWETYLLANLPIYGALPTELRARLNENISRFIPRVYWEATGDLELTEEMIVAVAAQACLLTMNMQGNPYTILKTIIIFPKVFEHQGESRGSGGTVTESRHRVSGISYGSGTVSLAWDQTQHGGRNMHDGQNVVFHEFAHQLDQADGYANGAPILRRPADYKTWARVMQDAYEQLVERSSKGKVTLLDDYGATDPAEFFAVATEIFFEKSAKMNKRYPELYEIMSQYYQLDPKTW
jgi:Mlc titration factor MtfA (ptsG expression regulator)